MEHFYLIFFFYRQSAFHIFIFTLKRRHPENAYLKYNWHDKQEQFDAHRKYCVQPFLLQKYDSFHHLDRLVFQGLLWGFLGSFRLLQPATLC